MTNQAEQAILGVCLTVTIAAVLGYALYHAMLDYAIRSAL